MAYDPNHEIIWLSGINEAGWIGNFMGVYANGSVAQPVTSIKYALYALMYDSNK